MQCFHQCFHLTGDYSLFQALSRSKLMTQFRKGDGGGGADSVILHSFSLRKFLENLYDAKIF